MYQQYDSSPYAPSGYATPLDNQLHWLHNYPNAEFIKGLDQHHLQPSTHGNPHSSGGTYSCMAAADDIRVFKPDAGQELEDDLGCSSMNDQQRASCRVSNQDVFRLVDKYTANIGR
jgi:hypothetical protein